MIPFIKDNVKLKGFIILQTTHNWTWLIYVSSKQIQKFQMFCRRTSETVDAYLDWFKMQYHNGEEEEEEEQEDDGGDDEQDIKTQISAYHNVFLQSCNAFHESEGCWTHQVSAEEEDGITDTHTAGGHERCLYIICSHWKSLSCNAGEPMRWLPKVFLSKLLHLCFTNESFRMSISHSSLLCIFLQTNMAIQFLHSNFPPPPSLRFSTWRCLEVAFHAISPGSVLVLPLYAGPPVRLLHPCCPRLVNSMVAGVKLHSRGWVLLSDHFALVYTVLDEFGNRHFEARDGHSTLPVKYRSDK